MDITAIIARNLNRWMEADLNLRTIQQVEQKSHLGFGTIRRTRNGDGNITVEKLQALAAAFGKTVAELVTENPDEICEKRHESTIAYPNSVTNLAPPEPIRVEESRAAYPQPEWPFEHVSKEAYMQLTQEGRSWVQARTLSAIEEAAEKFGTLTSKRSA